MPRAGSSKSRFESAQTGKQESPATKVNHERGKLEILFNGPADLVEHKVDVSRWLKIGEFARTLAEHYADGLVSTASRQTRRSRAIAIGGGFVPYVLERNLVINTADDVPTDLLTKFLQYLEERTSNGRPLAAQTRLNYWRATANVFERIARVETSLKLDFPHQPFAGVKMGQENQDAPDLDAIAKTLIQAGQDAIGTVRWADEHLPPVLKAYEEIGAGRRPIRENFSDLVAEVLVRYEGEIPARVTLVQTDLARAVEHHGYLNIRRLVHPLANDLMPFFILMAAHTGWNQQPLAHLKISRCEVSEVMGRSLLVISSEKFRANSIVRRSFPITDKQLSPYEIIEFVKRWTALLRAKAPAAVRDDLWLHHVMRAGANTYEQKHFDSLAGRLKQGHLNPTHHIIKYCESRDLKFTGIKAIRLAFAEMLWKEVAGDMLAMRTLLGHKTIGTAYDHYRTENVRRRDRESLAGIQAERERWIGSRGKVDTRNNGRNKDTTAATPGFICSDPFDSPLPSQRKGRMCDAYGRCPNCPLALTDADEGYALARLLQLHEKYEEAKQSLGISVWKLKYKQDAVALTDRWIPSLGNREAITAAMTMIVSPLPCLE